MSSSISDLVNNTIEHFSNLLNGIKTDYLGDFTEYKISKQVFIETITEKLQEKQASELTSKIYLDIVHYAFVCAKGIDISRVTHVVIHYHHLESGVNFKQVLIDYPEAKWILTVRRPVDMFYSWPTINHFHLNYNLRSLFNPLCSAIRYLEKSLSTWENINLIEQRNRVVIRLEDLHQNVREAMTEASRSLGLAWDENLVDSTFGGHKFISTTPTHKNLSGTSKVVLQPKYRELFSDRDICFIETLHKRYSNTFNYKFETEANMGMEEAMEYAAYKKFGLFTEFFSLYYPLSDAYYEIVINKRVGFRKTILKTLFSLTVFKIFLSLRVMHLMKKNGNRVYRDSPSYWMQPGKREEIIGRIYKFNSIDQPM